MYQPTRWEQLHHWPLWVTSSGKNSWRCGPIQSTVSFLNIARKCLLKVNGPPVPPNVQIFIRLFFCWFIGCLIYIYGVWSKIHYNQLMIHYNWLSLSRPLFSFFSRFCTCVQALFPFVLCLCTVSSLFIKNSLQLELPLLYLWFNKIVKWWIIWLVGLLQHLHLNQVKPQYQVFCINAVCVRIHSMFEKFVLNEA